jgi:hypothetical protein
VPHDGQVHTVHKSAACGFYPWGRYKLWGLCRRVVTSRRSAYDLPTKCPFLPPSHARTRAHGRLSHGSHTSTGGFPCRGRGLGVSNRYHLDYSYFLPSNYQARQLKPATAGAFYFFNNPLARARHRDGGFASRWRGAACGGGGWGGCSSRTSRTPRPRT